MNRLYTSTQGAETYLGYDLTSVVPEPSATALFLHGFMSDRTGEKAIRFRDALAPAGLAYVTVDFSGHGESSGSLAQLTGSRLLEDVAHVVEQLGLPGRALVLLGSSMGGWAASWYAALHPEQVSACILLAPAFAFGELLRSEMSRVQLAEWEKQGWIDYTTPLGTARLGYNLLRDLDRYPVEMLAGALRTPTLILHGMRDETVSYQASVDFASRSSN
ncbi:MAG: alpha/beta fold hydrolase [Acidobacteria bacterium]|nr:alpha/beta fold hydrolase [Acidobacteriota bacterium]